MLSTLQEVAPQSNHIDFIISMMTLYFSTSIWKNARDSIHENLLKRLPSLPKNVDLYAKLALRYIDDYNIEVEVLHRRYSIFSFSFATLALAALFIIPIYTYPLWIDIIFFAPFVYISIGHVRYYLRCKRRLQKILDVSNDLSKDMLKREPDELDEIKQAVTDIENQHRPSPKRVCLYNRPQKKAPLAKGVKPKHSQDEEDTFF